MELLEQLVLLEAMNATMLVVSFIVAFLLFLLIMVVLIGFTLVMVVFLRERNSESLGKRKTKTVQNSKKEN